MNMIIFVCGAIGYGIFEILFRGYTHWTMMLTGGCCILTIFYFFQEFPRAPLLAKALGGSIIITVFEFTVGLIVNIWFNWGVWDYTDQPGNVLGLVCPLFSLFWFILSLILAIVYQKIVPERKKQST